MCNAKIVGVNKRIYIIKTYTICADNPQHTRKSKETRMRTYRMLFSYAEVNDLSYDLSLENKSDAAR